MKIILVIVVCVNFAWATVELTDKLNEESGTPWPQILRMALAALIATVSADLMLR